MREATAGSRTARLAADFRQRAADVRSQILSRQGLPDDAPLAAAFVAPLRSCCPPSEGLREVEAEQASIHRHVVSLSDAVCES